MKKTIFILLLFMGSFPAFSQLKIHGVVKSGTDQLSLIGANVLVRGSSIGTVTDAEGKFELSVLLGSA